MDGVEALLASARHALPLDAAPRTFSDGMVHCPILLLMLRHLEASTHACAQAVTDELAAAQAARRRGGLTPHLGRVLHAMVHGLPAYAAVAWGGEAAFEAAVAAARRAAAPALAQLHCRALRLMDLLTAAGFRVHVFRGEGRAGLKQAAVVCSRPACEAG